MTPDFGYSSTGTNKKTGADRAGFLIDQAFALSSASAEPR
jgi:hypothetical protein